MDANSVEERKIISEERRQIGEATIICAYIQACQSAYISTSSSRGIIIFTAITEW